MRLRGLARSRANTGPIVGVCRVKIDFEPSDIEQIAQRVAEMLRPVMQGSRPADPDEILDVNGLAEFLKVDQTWVYKSRNKLPCIRIGKHLRFRRADVLKWIEKSTVRPSEELRLKRV